MEQQKKNVIFYEICRLCLNEHGHCDIFDRNDIQDNILKCIGIKVIFTDSLPQKICVKCLDIVTKAAELRVLAKINDTHLKSLFSCEDEIPEGQNVLAEELVETDISGNVNDENQYKNPAIEKFLSVRKDLFDSSVSEDSIINNEMDQTNCQDLKIDVKRNDENGEIEYKCHQCSKSFDKWKKLYLHKRLHNKNCKCPINMCSKKFASRGDLEKHLRTHTGEKPFNCDQCDKSFSQKGTLKTHKQTVHSESPSK